MNQAKSIFDVGVLEPLVSSYTWEINQFSINCAACASVEDRLLSSTFTTKHLGNTIKWRLSLYPKSSKEGSEGYLSIFVHCSTKIEITADITFSILNIKNENIVKRVMRDSLFKEGSYSWGYRQFKELNFILDEQNRVLENDTLKILCEFNFNSTLTNTESIITIEETDLEEKNEEPDYRLKEFDDFEKLLESEAFSDITFVVEEKKIHAHKAILVSRSPVFEVMLQHYVKEKQENSFEIADVKYEIMKELLRFMYVGKVNDINQQAADLLVVADKYSVAGLKVLCEKALYKQLNAENALEYLNLAASCDAPTLKSQVIEFIASNLKDVVEKPEFELFGNLNSKVICEVVRAISRKSSE